MWSRIPATAALIAVIFLSIWDPFLLVFAFLGDVPKKAGPSTTLVPTLEQQQLVQQQQLLENCQVQIQLLLETKSNNNNNNNNVPILALQGLTLNLTTKERRTEEEEQQNIIINNNNNKSNNNKSKTMHNEKVADIVKPANFVGKQGQVQVCMENGRWDSIWNNNHNGLSTTAASSSTRTTTSSSLYQRYGVGNLVCQLDVPQEVRICVVFFLIRQLTFYDYESYSIRFLFLFFSFLLASIHIIRSNGMIWVQNFLEVPYT